MSIEAISHVLKLDIARSSEKFILVCLANYADSRGYTYPSMAALERDTSQDRKTILSNVKRLQESALLRDTGKRVGSTRQVVVYQIVGLPESSRCHYVYRLTHPVTGEFYIGKRSFNGHPELDPYRGSGRWPMLMKGESVPLVREVVEVFTTNEEAAVLELRLMREADGNALCRNDQLPSRMRALANANSPENGTVSDDEEYQFSGETVPLFPENGPKNGTRNRQGTVKESVVRVAAPPRPEWVPEEPWEAYLTMRKSRAKKPTVRAIELVFARLGELKASGEDLAEVLNQSTRNNWTDVYAVKKPGLRGPRGVSASADLAAQNRAAAEEARRRIEARSDLE